MNVLFVCVGADDKGMVALRKAHGKFIAELIGFLRCDLTRFEGLPDLIRKGSSPTASWNAGHTMKYRRAWNIR